MRSYYVAHSDGSMAIRAPTDEQAAWVALHECEAQGSELIEVFVNVEEVFPKRLGDVERTTGGITHWLRP